MVEPDLVEKYLIYLNLKVNIGLKPPVKQGLSLGLNLWISFRGTQGLFFIHRLHRDCA